MKQKLVVVGNGMAGARAVEEVLARDKDRFDIVMFGAEPYGNYNRILLSNILSGAQNTSEIFINPLDWYEENGVTITRGFVDVDPLCRTKVPTISAVGDLINIPEIAHPQLAHVGFAEGILVAEQISGLEVTPIDYDGVPRITYSDPEVASVGITSAMAAERFLA